MKPYTTYIAGIKFNQGMDIIPSLPTGTSLHLVREPNNPYDPNAVAVYYGEYILGHIPSLYVSKTATVFDEGGRVCAEIIRTGVEKNVPTAHIRVFECDLEDTDLSVTAPVESPLQIQPPPEPEPITTYADEPSKSNWWKWALGGFAGLIIISLLTKSKENLAAIDKEPVPKTVSVPLPVHELLKQDGASNGRFVNLWFYVNDLGRDTAQIKQVAIALINEYCDDKTCNQVYFWRDKKAFELLEYKREQFRIDNYDYDKNKWLRAESKWKDKNWKFVCENLAANYDNNGGELMYEPYLDSDYRQHGGNKKRPGQFSTTLTLTVPKFHF
ncbi:HIRAN domain-containing protein [Spirosoma areae]